jgi:hypothetical protein
MTVVSTMTVIVVAIHLCRFFACSFFLYILLFILCSFFSYCFPLISIQFLSKTTKQKSTPKHKRKKNKKKQSKEKKMGNVVNAYRERKRRYNPVIQITAPSAPSSKSSTTTYTSSRRLLQQLRDQNTSLAVIRNDSVSNARKIMPFTVNNHMKTNHPKITVSRNQKFKVMSRMNSTFLFPESEPDTMMSIIETCLLPHINIKIVTNGPDTNVNRLFNRAMCTNAIELLVNVMLTMRPVSKEERILDGTADNNVHVDTINSCSYKVWVYRTPPIDNIEHELAMIYLRSMLYDNVPEHADTGLGLSVTPLVISLVFVSL